MENDDVNMPTRSLNTKVNSWSEYMNNTSAGTEMANLEEKQSLIDTDDAEDAIDGYKDPNDVDVIESGYQEGTRSEQCSKSSLGMRSAGCEKESHMVSDKVRTNESHYDYRDTSSVSMNSEPLSDIRSLDSHVNISIDKVDNDINEIQPSSFKDTSANEIGSNVSEDEISLNAFIEQREQCDDIYQDTHSGSTVLDESDKEQSETEFIRIRGDDVNVETVNTDIHLQTRTNVLGTNTDIGECCDGKMIETKQSWPSTVISISAIENHSGLEQNNALNDTHKSTFITSHLDDDTDTDLESLDGLISKIDEPEIIGYKQTDDVHELSDCELDSEPEIIGYKQTEDVYELSDCKIESEESDMDDDVGGYKQADDVSGMSESDSEVENTGSDQENPTNFVKLPVKLEIQDEISKNKNGFIKNGIIANDFIKLSNTDKSRSNSGSDNSIASTAGSSHGNSSSAVSYVKASEEITSKEENENQHFKKDLKIMHDKDGVKVPELTNTLQENHV